MTSPRNDDLFPAPEDQRDRAVRAWLDAEAAGVDADRGLASLHARLARDESPAPARSPGVLPFPTPRRWLPRTAMVAAAAGLLLALLLLPGGGAQAGPADLVARSRDAHAGEGDRLYRVKAEPAANLRARLPLLDGDREVRLWTRGDRFWAEPGPGGKGAWGQDAESRVWLAPTDAGAARFDLEELPEPIRLLVLVRGLQLPRLLGEVLTGCQLHWLPVSPGSEPGVRRIEAVPTDPAIARRLSGAELDVDASDATVRRLVLRHRLASEDLARVTFTLVQSGRQPDAAYTAEGHVRPGAPVQDRDRPLLRARVLGRVLPGR